MMTKTKIYPTLLLRVIVVKNINIDKVYLTIKKNVQTMMKMIKILKIMKIMIYVN